jgi:hypothetical protein
MRRQQNALMRRFNHPILTLATTACLGDGSLKVDLGPYKDVKWYWQLHRPERLSDLVKVRQYYCIDPREWAPSLKYSSTSNLTVASQDDRTESRLVTIEAAVKQHQRHAVEALCRYTGIFYERFEELERREKLHEASPLVKKRKLTESHANHSSHQDT